MPDITLTLTPSSADAVRRALDVYTRLCLGQIEIVGHLVRDDVLPPSGDHTRDRETASIETCARVDALLRDAKRELGYRAAGSMSIHHPHVAPSATEAFAVMRALDAQVATASTAVIAEGAHEERLA